MSLFAGSELSQVCLQLNGEGAGRIFLWRRPALRSGDVVLIAYDFDTFARSLRIVED